MYNLLRQRFEFGIGFICGIMIVKYMQTISGVHQSKSRTVGTVASNTAKDVSHEDIRIVCWIMTYSKNLHNATAVRDTWTKRCNKVLFMSDSTNSSFPTIGLGTFTGRNHLSEKTQRAFKYIYEHHFDEGDWFLKADDDTFVIMENLRHLLSQHSSQEPVYFGRPFQRFVEHGYNSGGAGYVLSKEALRRFYRSCDKDCPVSVGTAEDVHIGKCLDKLGVYPGRTLDKENKTTFHTNSPKFHLTEGNQNDVKEKYFREYDGQGGRKGLDVVSDYAISFHHLSPESIRNMEYFVYHIKAYGHNIPANG